MSSSSTSIVLPVVTIQPDFQTVISEVDSGLLPSEIIWVSCYKTGCPSLHAKVEVLLDEVDRNKILMQPKEGDVKIEQSEDSYKISCPPLEVRPTKILFPTREYKDPEHLNPQRPPHRITAFDVSPDGTQFATGFHDGSIRISLTSPSNTLPLKIPKPHLSTLTFLRFFPSSRVLLTAGADFALTIIPADLPSSDHPSSPPAPARVLKGHSRAITSTAIISRGRNVLSASKDGTMRLWDVSSGTQIKMMGTGKGKYTPITAMSVGEKGGFEMDVRMADGARDEREVDTADKLVFCALSDGTFEVFDLGSKQSLLQSIPISGSGGLTAISYSPRLNLLATGSSKGLITLYSTLSLSSSSRPLASFTRNGASIEDLTFTSTGLLVATDDGLPFVAQIGEAGPAVEAELVGGDCEGVRVVRSRDGEAWTAGDDGVVRVYRC